MFILKIYDRKGTELNEGDIVKISDGRYVQFFAEVKYSEQEQCIYPFHSFSFNSMEKVDRVPENAIKSSEERYSIWYLEDKKEDPEGKKFNRYLSDWRNCEHLLENKLFRITKQVKQNQLTIF